jgi:glyoxylase-like metal-dependent hydrolase (beta-lactamase superfamily II)
MKMKYETIVVGMLETNCYLVFCQETKESVIVDPGAGAKKILARIHEFALEPVMLVNTHGHIDHVGANKDILDKFDIPLCIHEADRVLLENAARSELRFFLAAKESPPPDRYLKDDDKISFGRSHLKVIHTPGHSEGSVSLLGTGFLLSGDTLFCGGVGRTDLPGGSWKILERTIKEKILTLPEDTIILPGHGPMTTVRREKESNPFV